MGDTVRVDKTITNNELLNASFNAFAATKQGRKFLSQYASKGQTIDGHTFKKDGKYSKKGIDLNYKAESLPKGQGGETRNSYVEGSRAQISVVVNSNYYEKTESGLINESFGKVITFFHESFIHADLDTKDFLDNKRFDHSNISQNVKNAAAYTAHHQHYQVLMDYMKNGYSNSLWPGEAFNGLKDLNEVLKVFPTDQALLNEMWNYSGGIQLDNNGKVKH
jgi:hypothetical protein